VPFAHRVRRACEGPPPNSVMPQLSHPVCPHAEKCAPFLVYHLCWQDRIAKERFADMSTKLAPRSPSTPASSTRASMRRVRSLTDCSTLELARPEYFPIGGTNQFNNNSSTVSKTLGCGMQQGGHKSTYAAAVGKTLLPMPGHSDSWLDEERRRKHAEAQRELKEIHQLGRIAKMEARRGAAAQQLEARRQFGEDTIIRRDQATNQDCKS